MLVFSKVFLGMYRKNIDCLNFFVFYLYINYSKNLGDPKNIMLSKKQEINF